MKIINYKFSIMIVVLVLISIAIKIRVLLPVMRIYDYIPPDSHRIAFAASLLIDLFLVVRLIFYCTSRIYKFLGNYMSRKKKLECINTPDQKD